MNMIHQSFSKLFADMYAILLKTQNYHWHVMGPNFKMLHVFFEDQYNFWFTNIDAVAERMVTLEFVVPATLTQIKELSSIKDGNHKLSGHEMVMDLNNDYSTLIDDLYAVLELVKKDNDEGSLTFLTDLIMKVEKMSWMLRATAGGF